MGTTSRVSRLWRATLTVPLVAGGVLLVSSGSAFADSFAPDAPTAVVATTANTTLDVSWTAPSSNGGSDITAYTATATDGVASFTCTWSSGPLECPITALVNGTTYTVSVVATNIVGDSPASTPITATPATVATAPGTPTLTPSDSSLAVSWTEPSSNGGSAITGYTATASDGSNTFSCPWTTGPLSCTISGLTNGTSYAVTVTATNGAGDSPSSSSANATPRTVPGAPTDLVLTPGNGSIGVEWTAPSDDGGSTITGYTATATEGVHSATCSWTTGALGCTISGLTNGTSYSLSVKATNGAGDSVASVSSSATPRTSSSVPLAVAVTRSLGNITVTWTAPSSNGGSTITGYTATATHGAESYTCDWTSGPLTCDISGANDTTTYSVSVVATNDAGDSSASSSVSATALATPSAPTNVVATIGNGTLTFAFTPGSTGGLATTDYGYSLDGGATFVSWGVDGPFTIESLTNGQTYHVSIAAVNDLGTGTYSTAVAATPATVPGAPAWLHGSRGNATANLLWNAPHFNGGSAITSYHVSDGHGHGCTTTTTSCTVSSLTNGTSYVFTVVAVNAQGASTPSNTDRITPATTPGLATVSSIRASDRSIVIILSAPSNNGGLAVTSFDYSLDGGATWHNGDGRTKPKNGTMTLKKLVNGTTYHLELRSRNAVGPGAATSPVLVTPRTIPGAPTVLRVTAGTHQATLSFIAPLSNGGSAITTYQYSSDAGKTWHNRPTGSTSTSFTVTGLVAATAYNFEVRAMNAAGAGAASKSVRYVAH